MKLSHHGIDDSSLAQTEPSWAKQAILDDQVIYEGIIAPRGWRFSANSYTWKRYVSELGVDNYKYITRNHFKCSDMCSCHYKVNLFLIAVKLEQRAMAVEDFYPFFGSYFPSTPLYFSNIQLKSSCSLQNTREGRLTITTSCFMRIYDTCFPKRTKFVEGSVSHVDTHPYVNTNTILFSRV